MAAVTGPGYGVPPPVRPVRRRWWLVWLVAAWSVVLLAGVFWSARNDSATVPEQEGIGQAVPELRRATGALVAAAQGDRWVLRLGELRLEDCSLNPAWTGRRASRDLTVYVPEGEARAALDGIVAGLPETYGAGVVATRGGTRLSLYADAGGFIAIDAEAQSTDQMLTVRADSGCRPPTGTVDESDPAAGEAPATLASTLAALGTTGTEPGSGPAGTDPAPSAAGAEPGSGPAGTEPGSGPAGTEPGSGPAGTEPGSGTAGGTGPEVRAVACPAGGVAATFVSGGGAIEPDSAPRGLPDGTTPVWAEPGGWAYRFGSESVVVGTQGGRLVVSVTTGCRAG